MHTGKAAAAIKKCRYQIKSDVPTGERGASPQDLTRVGGRQGDSNARPKSARVHKSGPTLTEEKRGTGGGTQRAKQESWRKGSKR